MLHENEIKSLFFEKIQTDAPDRFQNMRVYRIPIMVAGVAQWANVKDGDVTFKDAHDNVKPIIVINKGEIEERIKVAAANAKKKPKQKQVKEPKQKPVKQQRQSKQKQESVADTIGDEDVLNPGEPVVKKKKHIIFPIFAGVTIFLSFCVRFNDIPLFNPQLLGYGIFGILTFVLACLNILFNVIAIIATIVGNANKDVTKPNKLGSKIFLWFLGLLCFIGSIVCMYKMIVDSVSSMLGGVF